MSIENWDYCSSTCPAEPPEVACLEPPVFPDLSYVDEDDEYPAGTFANYTANYDLEQGDILYDVSYS